MNPRAATVSLITCLCLLCPAMGADKPVVVELWPGKVPDETDNIGPEKVHMSRRPGFNLSGETKRREVNLLSQVDPW